MSELPARLRDAVAAPTGRIAEARPRRLAWAVNAAGEVAWCVERGEHYRLPDAEGDGEIVGHYTDPAGFPERFATLVVRAAPRGDLTWERPAEVRRRWRGGGLVLEEASRRALDPDERPGVEVAAGVRCLPLRTPTLPPATHTNCYLLDAGLVVDPGSPDPAEIARAAELARRWGEPRAVFLTHHHADHVSGAVGLAERLGVPIWAHRLTADRVPFEVQRHVEEGERLDGWIALLTPGHAPGHLCLWQPARRQLVAGDMVASLGSIVVDPDDGDMLAYLASLERLEDLGGRVLYPAHGDHVADPAERLVAYRRHRLWREARIVEAMEALGNATLDAITRRAYQEVAPHILWLARRSTLAHLHKLRAEDRADAFQDVWFLLDG